MPTSRARVSRPRRPARSTTSPKQAVTLARIDLTRPEIDLHLLDHDATASALATPTREIRLRGSIEYTHWVVWTLAGKDFVLPAEPWTSPANALNTGEGLLILPPNESRGLWLEIAVS